LLSPGDGRVQMSDPDRVAGAPPRRPLRRHFAPSAAALVEVPVELLIAPAVEPAVETLGAPRSALETDGLRG